MTFTSTDFVPNQAPCGNTRREFLRQWGGGFAALPLVDLMRREAESAATGSGPSGQKSPHFSSTVKQVVFFFLNGGPSQVDTFDHKPALEKYRGKSFDGGLQIGSNGRAIGKLAPSAFPFRPYGDSGLMVSSLFPHVGQFADDLCVINSMYAETPTHSPGILQMNSGSIVVGRPSLGSWLGYGLGNLNDNLPSYVVMTDHRGGPRGGAGAGSSGFMPARYQGTLFRSQGAPVRNLKRPDGIGAGVGSEVLVCESGVAGGQVTDLNYPPVRSVVVGLIEDVGTSNRGRPGSEVDE